MEIWRYEKLISLSEIALILYISVIFKFASFQARWALGSEIAPSSTISPTSKEMFLITGTGPNIKNCAVVTWTNWDLQICLDNECKRKNLSMPSCFKSWIDLKHVYKKFYQRQPQGLNGALQVIYNLLPNPPIFFIGY